MKCPCGNYTALSKIVELLDSEESVESIVAWLDGKTDEQAVQNQEILSCGKRSRCRFRYGTSVAILNAIRDACQPYLQATQQATGFADVDSDFELPKEKAPTYEESFPSLQSAKQPETKPHPAASNILIPRKKKQQVQPVSAQSPQNILIPKKKAKRRIRPQLTTQAVVPSDNVWKANVISAPLQPPNKRILPDNNVTKEAIVETAFPKVSSDTHDQNVTPVKQKTSPHLGQSGTNVIGLSPLQVEMKQTSTVDARRHLENLVVVYVSLFRNLLVPSTMLELHFLMRLLALDPDIVVPTRTKTELTGDEDPQFFRPLFTNAVCCRTFAIKTLTALRPVLQHLPVVLAETIINCEPVRKHCGEVVSVLQTVINDCSRYGMNRDTPTETVTGNHALLAIPFDKERDSRHNYRTQAEIAVYKNREETRDAFLYELRAFMNVKGKVFRPQEMERAQDRVRQESRNLMKSLLSANTMWFAEFFCELLTQVGLAPVQETDEELLNIAGKEKLQKLQKRMSSRNSHASKSSKKIAISRSTGNKLLSPFEEARLLFPGYQEFFFLFLEELPFSFGFHLRGRMVKTILELLSNTTLLEFERRVMQLQLLARFLGYLVFSPNWLEGDIDLGRIQSMSIPDGLEQLVALGLCLNTRVSDAWVSGTSLLTIPWVTELIGMSKWDSLTQASKSFRRLLASLRFIQRALEWTNIPEDADMFHQNKGIVSFYLERFFRDSFGLSRLTSLPVSSLVSRDELLHDCVDRSPITFTTIIVFASDPHIEDLISLSQKMRLGLPTKSPLKARKLRPSVVSNASAMSPSRLFGEVRNTKSPGPEVKGDAVTLVNGADGNISTKLVEAFFHQHRVIKDVCDFAVGEVLKNAAPHIATTESRTAFRRKSFGEESSVSELKAKEVALKATQAQLRLQLMDSTSKSLDALCPSGTHPRVKQIAVSLSVAKGLESGRALINAYIQQEFEALALSNVKNNSKSVVRDTLGTVDDGFMEAPSAIKSLSSAMGRLQEGDETPSPSNILQLVTDAMSSLRRAKVLFEQTIPDESFVRILLRSAQSLDNSMGSFLLWTKTITPAECYSVISTFLRLVVDISYFSTIQRTRFAPHFDVEFLLGYLKSTIASADDSTIVELLQEAIDSRIINPNHVAQCLRSGELGTQERKILQALN